MGIGLTGANGFIGALSILSLVAMLLVARTTGMRLRERFRDEHTQRHVR